jgi:hypothetical protein
VSAHFHSSHLVRTLSEWSLVDARAPGAAFAEKLGQWVDIAGAIALRTTHTAGTDTAAAVSAAQPSHAALAAHVAKVRGAVEATLATAMTPGQSKGRNSLPLPKADLPVELASAFEPYRRFYLAQQREMDLKTVPLRAKVREALATASPALRQLAAMDAALGQILAERESRLLATVPNQLEKRFKHLRSVHLQTLEQTQKEDQIAHWMKPGAWLARFCQELHSVLLAELDVRLQPTLGLLEALQHDHHSLA